MKRINQIEPSLDNAEKKELMSVIDSGWYTESSKTKEFERMFASFVGAKYACVVTSGTAALYVGLKALGIKNGDEVVNVQDVVISVNHALDGATPDPVIFWAGDMNYDNILNILDVVRILNVILG